MSRPLVVRQQIAAQRLRFRLQLPCALGECVVVVVVVVVVAASLITEAKSIHARQRRVCRPYLNR